MARDEQVRYGAGGKALRRSRFGRVRSGPCDRPLSGRHAPPELRAAADPRRESWFSKIVGSSARTLKDSAFLFVSSLFCMSLPAIGRAPEDDSEKNKINDIQENEEPETEELYHEEEERNNLTNLGNENIQMNSMRPEFLRLLDDAGASPAEIAKAYMGGRWQPAPNCLDIQKKPLLNENTLERSVGIPSAAPLPMGSDQNYSAIVSASPSASNRTPLNTPPVQVESKAKNSLKRRSYVWLEEPITSNRRIRQKLHNLRNRNLENTFRTPENKSQISAIVTYVPPQSSEAAQKSSFVNVSNNTDAVRAKRGANEYMVHVSKNKRGFQMRAPEESNDEGNGNHTRSAVPAAIPSFNASVSSTHRKDCEQAKLDIPHFGVSQPITVSKSLPFSTSDPKFLIQSGNESGSQSNSSSFSFPVIPASTITEPQPTRKLESLGTLSTMKAKTKRLSAVRMAAVLRSLQQQLPQTPALNAKVRRSHGQLLSPMGIKALRLSLSNLRQSSILVRKIERLVNQAN